MGPTQIVSEIAKTFDPNLSLAFLIKGVLIKEKKKRVFAKRRLVITIDTFQAVGS